MSRQPEYIGAKGGDVIAQFQLDPATNTMVTASLVQGTNCMDLGHLANSSVELVTSVEKFKTEAGVNIAQNQTWEGMITANAMQTSDEIATWMGYTTRNMKLITYKLLGRKNAKYQEVFCVGENENAFKYDSPDTGGTPFKFNITPRSASVTLTTTQIASMRSALQITQGGVSRSVLYPYVATAVTIAYDVEFEIIET